MARGLIATLGKIAREAERDSRRRQREDERQHAQRHREAIRAHAARERATRQAARAAAANEKHDAAEAKKAHLESQLAEVEALNAELEETYAELDGLLAATLEIDDHFDLETLRREVEHPPFAFAHLEHPLVKPVLPVDPAEPVFEPPPPSKALFGRKKKDVAALALAQELHAGALEHWRTQVGLNAQRRMELQSDYDLAEERRIAELATNRSQYQRECEARDNEVAQYNASVDELISNLGYGVAEAVETYVEIVFSRSLYPDGFAVSHEVKYESATAELIVRVAIPAPDEVPGLKNYKYVKKSDEIVSVELSQKARKDRYASIVEQVALRTTHEVFEADRRGLAKMISLEVGTQTKSPATGKPEFISFVAVAGERDAFVEFDLSAVVPRTSLEHLGASLSKNAYGLVAADNSGIRRL